MIALWIAAIERDHSWLSLGADWIDRITVRMC
jgi:hypothetical protein